MVLMGLGITSSVVYAFHLMGLKQIHAQARRTEIQLAAESAVRMMLERLIGLAELRLGRLDSTDIAELQGDLTSLPLPAGMNLDAVTGYYVVSLDSGTIIPYDDQVIAATSDWPRMAYEALPLEGGVRADETLTVTILAAVRRGAARASARTTVAISTILPYQYAVYADDDVEVCASFGHDLIISGPIRAEGSLVSDCAGERTYAGDLYAQENMSISPTGTHVLVVDDGQLENLQTVTRNMFEDDPTDYLSRWGGRARLGAAIGDRLIPTGYQTPSLLGRGECQDGQGACAGNGSFSSSIQIQRTTPPSTIGSFDLTCNLVVDSATCSAVNEAITYLPYPFPDVDRPDSARVDPGNPMRLWQGLFPDYRREDRCTAQLPGGIEFRTFRCITNAFGYRLNVSQLPPIPGGLLHVKKWSQAPIGMGPYQEVLILEQATRIAGPLTIVSEIPVVIMGSLNTADPKPVSIDAPLITILPAEAETQLETAMIWDSVFGMPYAPMTAHSPVRIHAILRSNYHRTENGNYYGGTIEQIPAVLGDFGAVTLEVVGAIEGRRMAQTDWNAYANWFSAYGTEPSGFRIVQPRSRRIVWDKRLAQAEYQPRGSWFWPHLSANDTVGSRTRERQQRASGGYFVIRLIEEITLAGRSTPPDTIAVPAFTAPAAPTANFTFTMNGGPGFVSFDGTMSGDTDGAVTSYYWDFGDGSPRAFGSIVVHEYASAGSYPITLWVVDNDGLVSNHTETVVISP